MGFQSAFIVTSWSFDDRRGYRRRSVYLAAEKFGSGGIVTPCTVVELSEGGLRLISRQWMRPGQHLRVVLPRIGAIRGEVRWKDHDQYGIRFEQPLDPMMLIAAMSIRKPLDRPGYWAPVQMHIRRTKPSLPNRPNETKERVLTRWPKPISLISRTMSGLRLSWKKLMNRKA